MVEKGLASTRAATKANSLEALLLYIELDTPGPVIEELIPVLSHKQPKIIAATLSALTSIYHAYGCKTADPKPALKALPKVFGHADKNVRAEAQSLAVEFYRWLKEAMKPVFWAELKPVQQQDLDALFEKAKQDPPPQQERFLRSQQEAIAAAEEDHAGGISACPDDGEEEGGEELDTFDLAEPVDVTAKIPSDLHEKLASTKWKDRKDSLDALHAALNAPRIKDADFGEVVRSLAKCMKDANIAVVTVAANCVEALANGLRKGFGKYRSIVMGPLMERLKEKKQSVTDALGAALDAAFASTSLSECLEDTLEFLKHKNPQVKLESVRFLIRCLRTTKEAPTKVEVKLISDAATKLLTESSEILRSAAAEVLGTVMKIMGERAMNPYLDGMDEIRRAKVKEFFDKAEVKARDKPKPPAPAAAPKASKSASGKKVPEKKVAAAAPKPPSHSGAAMDEPSAPLQPRLTGRAIPSKLSGPPKTGPAAPSGASKLQKKLVGLGAGVHPPQSPQKHPASHAQAAPAVEDEPPVAARFGLGGRGLAGRPLGKPVPATQPTELASPTLSSGISSEDRAELEELRAEAERLRRMNEDLKAERSKLTLQIHELQNQNAQLIEDHTRDVLSIKAKETQLVRARSDAEAAEATCQRQQREMDRLKRELSRAVRATSPGPMDVSEQIYRDSGLNGAIHSAHGPNYGRQANKRPPFIASLSEEKENGGPEPELRSVKMSPSLSSARSSDTGGRGSPTTGGRDVRDGAGGGVNSEGVESWKRAAEVTSQLKARIEQMKVRPFTYIHSSV